LRAFALRGDVKPRRRASQDIRPAGLDSLDWRPEQARQSLDVIYQYVVGLASQSIDWYFTARRPKKRWAQRLRVGAIIMVAVAGVLPVLSQIFGAGSSVKIQPAWAAVALAIAVALVALDRFFGFSSAWARYMATGQAISAALNQFRLDWQQASCLPAMDRFTQESIDHLLGLARKLVAKTDDLVQAETLQWVKEFRETLTEIERSAQAHGQLSGSRVRPSKTGPLGSPAIGMR
jgi:low affinity Fe/Cu permease